MKKFYSIVLMATALLIGTNMQAESVSSWDALRSALEDGGEVTLSQDINVVYDANNFKSILIGAKNSAGTALAVDGTAPAAAVLDLAGHNITITANSYVGINPFVLTKGSLKVTGTGTIEVAGSLRESTNVFFVFGANAANKTVSPFSKLEIDENVTVKTNNGTVIAIDQLTASHAALTKTSFATKGYATSGMAYGVFVDVKGTLISQGATYTTKKCYGIKVNGNVKTPADDNDKIYTPYVHVYPSAVITSDMRSGLAGSTAIYASGFGQWLIEGTCSGASGVYISSGILDVNNATVKSGAEYDAATGGTHANGSGNGITINSRSTRGGEIELTVSGDTKVESTNGYALEEVINTTDENTKVESVAIEGGSFVGNAETGTISVTKKTAEEAEVTVAGGNVTGDAVIGDFDLASYLNEKGGTHATLVEDENGKTVLVITKGDAPDEMSLGDAKSAYDAWVAAGKQEADSVSVKLTGAISEANGKLEANYEFKELELNAADDAQILTVAAGYTLKVGRVVLGKNAQIIVEAGAKFIVYGSQGIVAPVASNIVLKASESAQATFLFNPGVTSNRHPNAKVEYHSNSFYSDHNVQQFFGLPTYNGTVTNIETTSDAKIYFDLWENPGWDYIGAINVPGDPDVMANLNKFNLPFGLVCITSKNDAAHKPVFTFSGELTGNMDHTFTLYQGWTSLANAYTGPIAGSAIISQLAAWNASYGTEQNVYVYTLNPATGNIQWSARNKYVLTSGGLNAMAPIMFHNGSKVEGVVMDYSTLVWDPFTKPAAPARRAINNITKAQINIAGENESDYTTIVADSELGNDRSFCAPKYDNAGLQLYVSGNEKFDIYAADEIENSYIGYRTVNAGMYTISFENVQGEDLVLVDLANGARTNIEEGAIYTFHAEANESNDYRFEIVGRANMPTAIENTEAVKSAKGVYTITGQYVGEMNVWNALPAGVYVVNGEKRVK